MRSVAVALFESQGQGWKQLVELLAALVLSTAIGLEREVRQKSAGLRTHALVGVGAALITLVSKYGFGDVLGAHVTLDPSRVAAQIVTGIGFIGGGVIFVRRDVVRGLTTASVVWLAAAVGMACGAGLLVLAAAATVAHFVVVYGYPRLARRVPRGADRASALRLEYRDGSGALRQALVACTRRGFVVDGVAIDRSGGGSPGTAVVTLQVRGTGSPVDIGEDVAEIDGVLSVDIGIEEPSE